LNPHERKVVAYHELGHAFVALSTPGSDAVHKVSIIPRGVGALGYTIQRPTEDRYLMSRSELENRMAVLLGGRASESVVFDEVSTGAADDLVKATDIARSMVARFGMAQDELGQVAYEDEPHRFLGNGAVPGFFERRYSETTAHRIDEAVRELIEAAYSKAVSLLEQRRETLDKAAEALLADETLSGDELKSLFSTQSPAPVSDSPLQTERSAAGPQRARASRGS
jgi:cell division protease FtsH